MFIRCHLCSASHSRRWRYPAIVSARHNAHTRASPLPFATLQLRESQDACTDTECFSKSLLSPLSFAPCASFPSASLTTAHSCPRAPLTVPLCPSLSFAPSFAHTNPFHPSPPHTRHPRQPPSSSRRATPTARYTSSWGCGSSRPSSSFSCGAAPCPHCCKAPHHLGGLSVLARRCTLPRCNVLSVDAASCPSRRSHMCPAALTVPHCTLCSSLCRPASLRQEPEKAAGGAAGGSSPGSSRPDDDDDVDDDDDFGGPSGGGGGGGGGGRSLAAQS